VPVLSKLTSSALLAIVAGSDTTAAVLSNIFYYLIREPEYFVRLRDELDALFRPWEPNESIDINSLSACPFLNAVVWVVTSTIIPQFIDNNILFAQE